MTPTPRGGLWAVRVAVPAENPVQRQTVEQALDGLGVALSSFEIDGGRAWTVEALLEAEPDRRTLTAALAAAGSPRFRIAYMPPRNWVARSQRLLAPIRAGRFFIHGAHFRGKPPRGAVALEVDAGPAFGTGRHETTRGSLLAHERRARAGRTFRRPLDLGCGSGILALAMARLWPAPVLAADSDGQAVSVTRDNADINGAAAQLRTVKSRGFAAAAVRQGGPYDLIAANILAKPLCRLAPGLARHLAPGGLAILSGLLTAQEDEVLAAQQRQGLKLVERRRLGDWSVLLLRRPRKRLRRHP